MIKAYSYIRFSTPEQSIGDSLRRQMKLSKDYADKHNLQLDDSLNMHDLGVSAYKGKNVKDGALGEFISAVDKGLVPAGSYLLVESLDRLSREKVTKALNFFLSILSKNIKIVTLQDERVYDENILDMTDLIVSIAIMSRANEESKTKSHRKIESWNEKILQGENKYITKWVPPWLEIINDKIIVIDERANLVKKIFNWVLEGYGISLIIQKIETEGIEPWGATPSVNLKPIENPKSRMPKTWHASRIQRILTNRQVLGEFTPRQGKHNQGETIKNYYPQIIDDKIFHKVQNIRNKRNPNLGNAVGRRGSNITNLFSGLLKCGYSQKENIINSYCPGKNDSSMRLINKGGNSPIRYLQCSKISEGSKSCERCRKYLRYDVFEDVMLTYIKDIDEDLVLSFFEEKETQIDKYNCELATLNSEKMQLEKTKKSIIDKFESEDEIPQFLLNHSKELDKLSSINDAEIDRISLQIKEHHRMKHATNSHLKEIKSLISEFKSNKENREIRLKLSEFFRQVIEKIEIYNVGKLRNEDNPHISKMIDVNTEDYKRFINKFDKIILPIFVIFFKSGLIRVIVINPNDRNNESVTFKILENYEISDLKAPFIN